MEPPQFNVINFAVISCFSSAVSYICAVFGEWGRQKSGAPMQHSGALWTTVVAFYYLLALIILAFVDEQVALVFVIHFIVFLAIALALHSCLPGDLYPLVALVVVEVALNAVLFAAPRYSWVVNNISMVFICLALSQIFSRLCTKLQFAGAVILIGLTYFCVHLLKAWYEVDSVKCWKEASIMPWNPYCVLLLPLRSGLLTFGIEDLLAGCLLANFAYICFLPKQRILFLVIIVCYGVWLGLVKVLVHTAVHTLVVCTLPVCVLALLVLVIWTGRIKSILILSLEQTDVKSCKVNSKKLFIPCSDGHGDGIDVI